MESLKSVSSFMDDAMDIDDAMIAEVLTPTKNKAFCPMQIDEDSGLGMDFELNLDLTGWADGLDPPMESYGDLKVITDTPVLYREIKQENQDGDGVFHLARHAQKRIMDTDEQGSYCKRRHEQSRLRKKLSKKSLSFGDTPLPVQKEAEVISAVHRLTETDDVTGDGSRTCCLPTIIGKHNDLKNISNDTVVDLINGKYNDVIESYQLIDCRYPYEYEAGHVTGALNIFKDEKIPEILSSRRQETDNSKRHILIFYCEFSSERGPKMCRKLRTADRELNCQNYPHLNFPEIYVMHNGYKAFYHSHEEYCTPQDYKPMLHKDHAADLRHFRSKSKSWSAGERRRSGASKLLF